MPLQAAWWILSRTGRLLAEKDLLDVHMLRQGVYNVRRRVTLDRFTCSKICTHVARWTKNICDRRRQEAGGASSADVLDLLRNLQRLGENCDDAVKKAVMDAVCVARGLDQPVAKTTS